MKFKDRRNFLKGMGVLSGSAVLPGNLVGAAFIGDTVLDEEKIVFNASHFGAFTSKVRQSRIVEMRAFEKDPLPSPMVTAAASKVYSPSKILRPCVRESFLKYGHKADPKLRGKEKFVEVSWDVALDLVANELKRVYKDYGKDALFGGCYGWRSASNLNHARTVIQRMLNITGGYVKHVFSYSTHCISAITPYVTGANEAQVQQMSWPQIIENSECVVLWSADLLTTNQIAISVPTHLSYKYLKELKEKGIKVINIDPVQNHTAQYLNAEHIKVNPTTDVALMLGIAYFMVKNNLHDTKFLKRYTVGYGDFEKYLLGETDGVPKTPKWAEAITGVSQKDIENLARVFTSKRTMFMGGWGMQRADHGEQPHWMLVTLASMVGQIGLPGGGFGFRFHASDGGSPVPTKIAGGKGTTPGLIMLSANTKVKGPWSNNELKYIPASRIVECLENPGKEIDFDCKKLTYPDLKMAYWAGGNPFHHHQDRNRMIKAWEKLETFVVHEYFWNATAKMGDIVLPAATELERNDIAHAQNSDFIFAMKKTIEPIGEAKSDYDICCEILKRFSKEQYDAFTEGRDEMGWIKYFYNDSKEKADSAGIPMPSFEEFWEKGYVEFKVPKDAGEFVKLSKFRADPISNRLGTPSGKIEIVSKKIARANYKDCKEHPTWMEPFEWLGSEKTKKFPLNLVTPHPRYRLHSQLNNTWLKDLEEVQEREPIWINPIDAKKRGLKSGDVVKVFNDRGAILAGVVVTERVKESVVRIQEGAWYDPQDPRKDNSLCVHGDVNVLIHDKGSSELAQGNKAEALVEIEKFEGKLPPINAFSPPEITRKG